jgi:hypothetical protein
MIQYNKRKFIEIKKHITIFDKGGIDKLKLKLSNIYRTIKDN